MTHTAIRTSGFLLISGAVLLGLAIARLSFQSTATQSLPPDVSLLLLLSSILLLLSLPGVYAKQSDSAGWLGLLGHALLQTGLVLLLVVAATPLMYPSIRQLPGESLVAFGLGIALTLGLLLTGIATLQAGVYSRWAGGLLLVAMAGFFFDFFIAEFLPPIAGQVGNAAFGVFLALALAWIGYSALTSSV